MGCRYTAKLNYDGPESSMLRGIPQGYCATWEVQSGVVVSWYRRSLVYGSLKTND